ncbi:MAG: penicillin-binding protein 2, partial [Cyanobacteria bacterium J06598_3]
MASSTRSRRRKLPDSSPRSTPEQIQSFRSKSPRLRLISVWLVLLAGMLGLGTRLAYLQLVIGSELKQKAQSQQASVSIPRTSRRQMVDRQGN